MKIYTNRKRIIPATTDPTAEVARTQFLSVLQPDIRVVLILKDDGPFTGLKAFHLSDGFQIWIQDASSGRTYRIVLKDTDESELGAIFDDFVSGGYSWKSRWKWCPSTVTRSIDFRRKLILGALMLLAPAIILIARSSPGLEIVIFGFILFHLPHLFQGTRCMRRRRRRSFWLFGYQMRVWNVISILPTLAAFWVAYTYAQYSSIWLGILGITALFSFIVLVLQLTLPWMPVFRDNKHVQQSMQVQYGPILMRAGLLIFWIISWLPQIKKSLVWFL